MLLGKTLTTPGRLADGIETGVAKAGAGFAQAQLFLHGTTVAINTILERSGARLRPADDTGLPRHLRDRPGQPAGILQSVFPQARAADRAALRFEIRERIDAQGTVLIPLDEDEIAPRRGSAIAEGAVAIAIVFLHSYRNPAHEPRAKEIVARDHPELFVTASHELSQEYREFERTSTVGGQCLCRPARAALSRRNGRASRSRPASPAAF